MKDERGHLDYFDEEVRHHVFILSSLAVRRIDERHATAFAKEISHLRNLYRAHRLLFAQQHIEKIQTCVDRFNGMAPPSQCVSDEETRMVTERVLSANYPPPTEIRTYLRETLSVWDWYIKQLDEGLLGTEEDDFCPFE